MHSGGGGTSGLNTGVAKRFLINFLLLPIAVLEVHLTLNNERERLASKAMRSRPSQSAVNCNTITMKTMKMIKTPVVLSLLLALAGGVAQTVRAEDKPASPTPPATKETAAKKPVQQQLAGKVVAVDKYGKTITLQVNNLTYVLQITDSTRVGKGGDEQSIADVVVGEEINVTVLLRELPDGRVEVAVLSVDLDESAEAQGHRGNAYGRGRNGNQHGPFHHGPHPPNIDGPVVSPYR